MITVIMNTTGAYPELIEEALGSLKVQNNQNFELIIVNINPNPFICDIDARIFNLKPFDHFKEQVTFGLKQVKTRWWTFVDSDDFVFPNHINNIIERTHLSHEFSSPQALGCKSLIMEQAGEFSFYSHGCITRYVMERMEDSFYEKMCARHKRFNGFEHFILDYPMWNKVIFDQLPTYVYRVREDGMHKESPNGVEPLRPLKAKVNLDLLNQSQQFIHDKYVDYHTNQLKEIMK